MINEAKYLGIQIDKTLSWKEHSDIIASNISQRIGMLRYAEVRPTQYSKNRVRNIVESRVLGHGCFDWWFV